MTKKFLFFFAAVAISLIAAVHRWDDSAHSIGLIKARGGEARHPVSLASGRDRYVLIATASVVPPYRGDARVELNGEPKIPCALYAPEPVVDLGLRHVPRFRDNTFYGLRPGDRLALWVLMRPPRVDPVCGMACEEEFLRAAYRGKEYCFCGSACRTAFEQGPGTYRNRDHVRGRYTLTFYDTKTEKSVLNVPINFAGKGEMTDGHEHHH